MRDTLAPTFGHPVKRDGKPYIWVTWLTKLLGADAHCRWAAWFKAHYKHKKFEQHAEQLQEWNRDHTDLMRQVRDDLEANGWTCTVEDQNSFKLDGQAAVVAGKPDLIGRMPGHVLIVDGKTGKRRDADDWQLLFYLYAYILQQPRDFVGQKLTGEVRYRSGTSRITPSLLTPERKDAIVRTIKVIAADKPPARAPSAYECSRCDIGFADCPQRVEAGAEASVAVGDF